MRISAGSGPDDAGEGSGRAPSGPALPLWRKILYGSVVVLVAFILGVITDYSSILRPLVLNISMFDYSAVVKYLDGRTASPQQLAIDVSFRNLQKLAYERKVAFENKRIITNEKSYVAAEMTAGDVSKKVRIRLKGDVTDHLEGRKWSLRVKVRNGDALFGMNRFSIQDPRRSGWITEWVFHELLKYEGLIALKYDFVNVAINGADNGIYALEESFGKELVARNRRPEGPILKFDESILIDRSRITTGDYKTESDIFLASDIISFYTDKTFRNEKLRSLFLTGRSLLSDFRSGEKTVAEVFDLDATAKLFALAELAQAQHALRWKNIRFYMNPVTFRLEPVGYNAYTENHNIFTFNESAYVKYGNRKPGESASYWMYLFFRDEQFLEAYFSELSRIGSEQYAREFFSSIKAGMREKLKILYRDYPLMKFSVSRYYNNGKQISEFLNPRIRPKAYMDTSADDEGYIRVRAGNTTRLPIVLDGFYCVSRDHLIPLREGVTLPPKQHARPVEYQTLVSGDVDQDVMACTRQIMRQDRKMVLSDLMLEYRLPGSNRPVRSYIDTNPLSSHDDLSLLSGAARGDLDSHPNRDIFRIDHPGKKIIIDSGDYQVAKHLVFPAGYTVQIRDAVNIDLVRGASLISHSPVMMAGTRERPVTVRSSDGTGGGLAVLNAGRGSELNNVQFVGLRNPSYGDWSLTGAVTFYESGVSLAATDFYSIHAEDALNIIRSDFSITGADFRDTLSDAVDSDFSTGSIRNSSFTGCGNDCIDASGSRLELENVAIDSVQDKGISAGEESHLVVDGVKIDRANLAIVSKDSSVIEGVNVSIADAKVCFAAYRKKPEFGQSRLELDSASVIRSDKDYLMEEGSVIRIGESVYEPNASHLRESLYPSI